MLTRTDIETALQLMQNNNLVRLARPAGTWYMMHCPFHSDGQERKPSCECSLEGSTSNGKIISPGHFYCFSCGASYSFSKGVKEIISLKGKALSDFPELKKYVDDAPSEAGDSLIPSEVMSSVMAKYAVEDLRLRTRNKISYVPEEELAQYRFTVPYMYERKLTDAIIEKYDIGFDGKYIPPGRKKPVPCVTFPVHDHLGRTIFIGRRSIEGKFFYLPEGVEKSVYGIYELPANTKEVIICESVFNALTCVAYGHPAVALFGTGTPHEMDQLKRLGVTSYVICLDNDLAGRRGAERIKKALQSSAIVWTMTVPEDKDANDLTEEEFEVCYATRS